MLSKISGLKARQILLLGFLPLVPLLRAQSSPTPPPATPITNTQQLEVEIIEAHNKIGIPSEIQRKPGKFILAVRNASNDPNAWFVIDAAPSATSATSAAGNALAPVPAHVVTIGSGLYERKHRSASVFDALPGTYQLKFGTSGTVLCTIVIQ